jgi:ABC-type nitrate/sulfonate/bicarbonate transport system substrate-binding protein
MHLTGPRLSVPSRIGDSSRFFVLTMLLCAGLIAAACSSSNKSKSTASEPTSTLAPKSMTFMAGFKAQANLPFVGVYVAQEKGFFKQENLSVTIRHAQAAEHLQLLLAGEVQVTTANGAQVLQRDAQNLPMTSIGLIGQKSEQGFVVGANSGITKVSDFAGKKLGYKGTVPVEFLALAKSQGLDVSKVNQVRVGFDPRVLSEGQVDILSVFVSNEPGQLSAIGYPTKLFDPSEFGIAALGLTYVATPAEIKKDPDLLSRFLKASLHGIEWADANREEAVDIVMKYAPQENRDQQKFMMTTELDRAKVAGGYGSQTQEQWQKLEDTLLEYNAIDKKVDLSQAYSDQFPKSVLKDGKVIFP